MENLRKRLEAFSTFKNTGKTMFLDEALTKDEIKDSTLYFGTGLASVNEASSGFGVEFLNTVLTSLWLQRQLGFKKVIHEISTVGYNIDEEKRKRLIAQEEFIVQNLIRNLHLEDKYQLNFSHNYHNSREFNNIKGYVDAILSEFSEISNFSEIGRYTALQLTGMKYLYDKENTRIKLGWITDKKSPMDSVSRENVIELINKGHLNEYYFDHMYRYVFPQDKYSFLYTPCAIDLGNGNRTVPYTVTPSQTRPVLNGRSIEKFVGSLPDTKSKKKVIKSWEENIVNLFEEMFYPILVEQDEDNNTTILRKLDYIQKKVLNLEKSKPVVPTLLTPTSIQGRIHDEDEER